LTFGRGLPLAIALPLVLVIVGCGGSTSTLSDSGPIVGQIPWTAPETTHYRLLRDDDAIGTADLRIAGESGGTLTFTQDYDFPDQKIKDSVEATTESQTLQPRSAKRTIDGPEGKRTWDARYEGAKATIEQHSEKEQRTDTLNIPRGSYDTWTDIFLWRTIAFSRDYQITYQDALTCTLGKPDIVSVALKVTGKESVTVPAGTFDAWRLEIRSGGKTQTAWYADNAIRTLIRYDNTDLVFELQPA